MSFYRGETLSGPDAVPDELVVPVSHFLVAMRGTEKAPPRCVALGGVVGESVACGIYSQRSSTCRSFTASYEDGVHHPECDAARAKHGLAPLTPVDWVELPTPVEAAPRRRRR